MVFLGSSMDWLFGKTPITTAREFGSYNMDDSFIITRPKSLERSNTTMSREGVVKRDNSLNGILFWSM
jgi:hypothetical protein